MSYVVDLTRLTFFLESHTVLVMRRFGLTLVELILIIGIIAVLFALLTPSLQMSRLQAKAVVCMSNIRQLNLAFSAYATDSGSFPYGFNDLYENQPPAGGYAGNHLYDRMGWWWFNYLRELYKKNMGTKTALQCPSKQMQQSKLKSDILAGNYGVNLSVCNMSSGDPNEFVNKPRACSGILHPAQTLLIVDSGYAIISWQHAADVPPVTFGTVPLENTAYVPGLSINRQRQLLPEQETDALYGRHPQLTVNVGFADGHVARTKAEDLLVKKAADGHYQNQYPLWTPDSK